MPFETPEEVIEIKINKDPQDIDIKPVLSKVEAGGNEISINSATEEDLVNLKGIGKGTAKTVLELREKSPFTDFTDLNSRAPLSFGCTWENFNITFE